MQFSNCKSIVTTIKNTLCSKRIVFGLLATFLLFTLYSLGVKAAIWDGNGDTISNSNSQEATGLIGDFKD